MDNFSNIIMKMGMVLIFGRIVGILVLCYLNMDPGSAMTVSTVNAKVSHLHTMEETKVGSQQGLRL